MIKIIFFDFDGVLTMDKSGAFTTCTYLHKKIPDVSFDDIYQNYQIDHPRLLIGEVHHTEVWSDFCSRIGKDLDIDLLYEAFRNIPVNGSMMNLCKSLQVRYTLGIITDNSVGRMQIVKETLHLSDLFTFTIVSGDVGAKKDNKSIFEVALNAYQCIPEECVFIDNNEYNLVVPRSLGIKTIHHNHEKNDVELLKQNLTNIGVAL